MVPNTKTATMETPHPLVTALLLLAAILMPLVLAVLAG